MTNADGGPTTLTAGVDNSSTTFSGHLDDGTSALAFVKAGAGTMILASPGTYSGGTSIFPGTLVAAASNALGTGPVQLIAGTLIIQEGVTLPNQINFADGGTLNNAGTLNNSVLDGNSAPQVVINSGVINGNVELGGSSDVVQLFTGSKINGSLSLSGTSSTLILDGAGQEILSQAVTGPLTNTGSLIKQGAGTWTIDRSLQAPLMTDILAGTLVLDAALDSPTVNISAGAFLQLNSGGNVANLVNNGLLFFAGSGTVNSTGEYQWNRQRGPGRHRDNDLERGELLRRWHDHLPGHAASQ